MEVVTEKRSTKAVPVGYKRAELGVIPEDWEVRSVGEAFEIRNTLRLPISRRVRKSMKGKYPYYGPTGIQDYINEYRIEGKHALIGEDGDHFLKWKEMSMTLLVDGKFNVNNHAHVVRGVENLTEWFFYFFKHRDITSNLKRQGAGRYKLNKSTLVGIQCAIPPLTEQKTIVDVLQDVDALIAELDALIEKKQQVKKGAMQQLLTPNGSGQAGKKRLPGFDGEWEEYQLGTLGDFKTSSVNKKTKDSEKSVRLLNYMDVYHNNIISNDFNFGATTASAHGRNSSNLLEGDILFTPSSETPDDIGHSAVITEDLKNTVYSYHLMRFRLFNKNIISKKFSGYVFNAPSVLEQFASRATGSTRYTISKKDFNEVEVSFPKSLEEQNKIAEILFDMDAEIQALQSKRAKYQKIKQGMMQELLTGKTRLV